LKKKKGPFAAVGYFRGSAKTRVNRSGEKVGRGNHNRKERDTLQAEEVIWAGKFILKKAGHENWKTEVSGENPK